VRVGELEGPPGLGEPRGYEGVECFGMDYYGFEVFDGDPDVELGGDLEGCEVCGVEGYGRVEGVFEYFYG
jgi:hypothetical protein